MRVALVVIALALFCTACDDASYSTSSQLTVAPSAMARLSLTLWARPIGSAFFAAESAAVMSLPHTV